MRRLASVLIILLHVSRSTTEDSISPWDPPGSTSFIGNFNGCLCREYTSTYATCYNPENCRRFPRNFRTGLNRFRLATTSVENITIADLDNLTNIEALEIEANKDLKWIESGAFSRMTRLKSLSISYNSNLQYLEEDVFEGLINLENLSIRQNSFDHVKNFSFSLKSRFMPNLRKLELIDLRCMTVDKDDFRNLNGSLVEEFNLIDSQVEYIHPDALLPLTNLKVLNLGENLINASVLIALLDHLTLNNITLNTLSLYGWGFKKYVPKEVLEIISKSRIKELILSKNQFDIISDDLFPYMPDLQILHLNEVLLSNFTFNAFSKLPNLRTLCLTKNKFPSIPKGAPAQNLKELVVTQEARYFTLDNDTFVNMSGLEKLDLSSNNIRKIPKGSFTDIGSFDGLTSLKFLSLERNPFPNRTFCPEVFAGLRNLEELELAYCAITHLPLDIFKRLPSLRRLDLNRNQIKTIDSVVFSPLTRLEWINLSWNMLSAWSTRLFKHNPKMTALYVNNNKITHFTKAILEDILVLDTLDLSGNLFNCVCSNFKVFSNLNRSTMSHILSLLNQMPNTKCVTEKFTDYTIMEYFNKTYLGNECKLMPNDILLDYLIPSIVLLIICALTAIILYIYRWHIRYWIFLTKMFLSRRAQFNRSVSLEGHDNYLYDAFVSYSSEDRNFVVRLVAMLENYEPFLKLCVYERDFEIGTFISESVLECVSRSRKTLLIISNSYIKSQWCRWEAQVAENHRLFFENEYGECVNDSIIMVKLGTISQANLSPMLKYLMKTRIYLQWDSDDSKQRQFWEKLRNALAPPVNVYAVKKEETISGDTKD
ncbi:TIR domain [Popillia japonica]|uniref:TIR domain n=1 Tax=Popillia japonica TaxID=7064 RepID=A0AAW1KL39_POPJA